jgi:putative ABC transport system ATP-binding protein
MTNTAARAGTDVASAAASGVAARTEAVTKTYGGSGAVVTALDNVTINIPRGRFTGVMGPSGSGKSTLMHCLAGLDTVDSGRVFVGDAELTRMKDKQLTQLRRDRIGFVFQSFNLVPTLTALENITLPMRIAGRRPDQDWLDAVVEATGLGDRLDHRPSQLSGGQQQRVACARALAARPDVIFADEPTGNLDSHSSGEVLTFLRESVRLRDQTIVMVTHDPMAASYTDNVVFLSDGRIVGELPDPTAATVLEHMKSFELPSAAKGRAR